ncbi:hypothetical protein EHS13_12535 [Paenibacillus psychroresistens]|uniref:Uncharacterized protein n=1 Tax=Paenibacillus psychroresistens TaxID=1778678 RepID=A0A6B8RJ88_9BACL|nr:hypothetical protein [Paenibacillus psychroresistens]QGQ95652.1 hypothetical protein EHS13_12535 [Paenibacillus psychroresistens]
MEISKTYVDYYLDRFSHLLTREEPKPGATQEEIAKIEQKQLNDDTIFIQELNGFLYRDQGVGKDIKTAVITAIKAISTRTEAEIVSLLKRSPQFADKFN